VAGYVAFGGQASIQGQLAASRQKIDKIDRQIVDLINQRAAVVEKIGKIKSAGGLPITAPHREQEVLRRVADIGAAWAVANCQTQENLLNSVGTDARLGRRAAVT